METKNITWEAGETSDERIATITFGENGYLAFFITKRLTDYEVETHCFNSQGDGFDTRTTYFNTEEECRWFVELMAETAAVIESDKQN